MAYLKYSDVPVFANFTTDGGEIDSQSAKHMFAATEVSISLDANNGIKRFLGGSPPEMRPQGPMEAKISMTFYPMIENSPSNTALNIQRNNQIGFFSTTGDFESGHNLTVSNLLFKKTYLQSYSIKINPYQPVTATANFVSYDYTKTENLFLEKGKSFKIPTDPTRPTYEALHGLTTIITSQGSAEYLPQTKTSVDINVSAQRTPIYTIGSILPNSVKLITLERDVTIQGEGVGRIMDYKGRDITDLSVYFLPLSQLGVTPSFQRNVLNFNINGKILSQQINVAQSTTVGGRISIKEILL